MTRMYLIQVLLPLRDNAGHLFGEHVFKSINGALVGEFGGVTAFSLSPAKGTWVNANREERDDVIVVEVMAEALDRLWWQTFRKQLEADLGQAEIVVRALAIERL